MSPVAQQDSWVAVIVVFFYLCGKVVSDYAAFLVAEAGVELDAEVNRRARTRAVLRSQKHTRPIHAAQEKCGSNRTSKCVTTGWSTCKRHKCCER